MIARTKKVPLLVFSWMKTEQFMIDWHSRSLGMRDLSRSTEWRGFEATQTAIQVMEREPARAERFMGTARGGQGRPCVGPAENGVVMGSCHWHPVNHVPPAPDGSSLLVVGM